MNTENSRILEDVDDYYTEKLREHGTTPRGVDWKDRDSQVTRFDQLLALIKRRSDFTINDLGCGYGALREHMQELGFQHFDYTGYDISQEMITTARDRHPDAERTSFAHIRDVSGLEKADFTLASGIFNVRFDHSDDSWTSYVLETINQIDSKSRDGFSFNVLTSYSDPPYMRKDLYYADPCFFFDYCKRTFSRNVALLHDYELYEFTILVKKG